MSQTVLAIALIVGVIALLVGPLCLYAGILVGMHIQFRAQRGIAPQPIIGFRPEKVEVAGDDDDPETIAAKAAESAFAVELSALNADQLKDKAEFFGVRYDERPEERQRVIDDIVLSRFHPGPYRA